MSLKTAAEVAEYAHGVTFIDETAAEAFTITASQSARSPRVLKYGDTFIVLDSRGDIRKDAGGILSGGSAGLFHNDTRHLSRLEFLVNGAPPLLLGSTLRDDNSAFFIDLTNPDLMDGQRIVLEKDRIHIQRTIFLWRDTAYQRLGVRNYGDHPTDLRLAILFDNDFADLFEVRGAHRDRRGVATAELQGADRVLLLYKGLDNELRRTALTFDPPPDRLTQNAAIYRIALAPGQMRPLFLTVSCDQTQARPVPFLRGMIAARREMRAQTLERTSVETSNDRFNEILCRSAADLAMLMTDTPQGRYPYAGIPWYSTTFGRDGLITALQMLWWSPEVARGVLRRLAFYQAKATDPLADAQPGKILHEMRGGEMAALREVPFGLYYGSVDATPLFVLLAGLYAERTGDIETVAELWPAIEAALAWIDGPGDPDGDGFVEYMRATDQGLANQGWKDSHDAIFHADGSLAEGAIALVEVQGLRLCGQADGGALRPPSWPRDHGEQARRAGAPPRRAVRGRILVLRSRHLRARARRRQKALQGAHVECRANPVHRHRRGRSGRQRCQAIAAAELLFWLGHSHRGARSGALQPDVLSQRLGLAA